MNITQSERHPLKAIEPPTSSAANSNDLQARYWREMRELIVRGVNEPSTLTHKDVSRVSGIALLGLNRLGTELDVLPWPSVSDPDFD